MLELAYKPDAAEALKRMEAWWHREVLDRPTVQIWAPKPPAQRRAGPPAKTYASLRDRWMDVEHIVASVDAGLANTYCAAEAMPAFNPNLGPDLLPAGYGCALEFGESTSWSVPFLTDYADVPKLHYDPKNEHVRCIMAMTKLALEVGKGKFLVGFTDIHPGADLIGAIRDLEPLCIDLATEPAAVHRLMDQCWNGFWDLYEQTLPLFQAAGQRVTTCWLPLYTKGKYYVPSNDFSCNLSKAMFDEFFLPEIIAECEYLDHSCYHLDGPGALRHLDSLLSIDRLDGIQWVYGAGHEPASQWLPVCRKIQDAGKCLHINIGAEELDVFMENLRPEGVMLCLWVGSAEQADALLAKVRKWPRRAKITGRRTPARRKTK